MWAVIDDNTGRIWDVPENTEEAAKGQAALLQAMGWPEARAVFYRLLGF